MKNKFPFFPKPKPEIFLILLVFSPFLFLLFSGKVIFWGTASLQFVPWNQFLFDSLLNGHLPLWNPYNGLGVPFVANHQSAVFYPLNWILFGFYVIGNIKGLAIGLTLLIPVHLSIAGIGMMKLLNDLNRSKVSQFIGAIILVSSGYILTRLSFISMVWTFAWVPWIVYASIKLKSDPKGTEATRTAILALLLAFQLLAGHAQTTFYSILLAGFFILFHNFGNIKLSFRKFLFFLLSILFSVLVAAVQIFPTYEFLKYSQRSSEIGYEIAVSSSLWPGRLITILFGNFWGNPDYNRFLTGGNFWEENMYLGVFSILFTSLIVWFLLRKNRQSQLSKTDKVFLVSLLFFSFFSIIYSFGRFTPVFPFLYKYIPTFNLFQAPSRFLLVYTFLMSILFSFGYDLWILSKFNHRKTTIYFVVFIGLLLASIGINNFFSDFPSVSIRSLQIGCLLGFLFGTITLIKDKLKVNIWWIHFSVIFTIIFDLISNNFLWNIFETQNVFEEINNKPQFSETKRVFLSPDSEKFLKFNLFFRPDRLQSFIDNVEYLPTFIPNTNLLNDRFIMVNNFDPLQLQKFSEFFGWISTLNDEEIEKMLSMVGGEHIISLQPTQKNFLVDKNIISKEIVQWYSCEYPFESNDILKEMLLTESIDPNNRCIFIENSLPSNEDTSFFGLHKPDIDYEAISSNKLLINYSSETAGWIVIRQNWYPGWSATIDQDGTLEIIEVDYLFQGIKVPAGNHEIELKYSPKSFIFGLVISFLAIIATIIYFFYYSNPRKT